MTFIATVIARDGAAVIADSLVTVSEKSLTQSNFRDYVHGKATEIQNGEAFPLPELVNEINDLFQYESHHTEDYAEKLFQFSSHCTVAIAGSAYLCRIPVAKVIQEIAGDPTRMSGSLDEEVDRLKKGLMEQIQQGAEDKPPRPVHSFMTFQLTHFDRETKATVVAKLLVRPNQNAESVEDYFSLTTFEGSQFTVVPDGQFSMTTRMVFGTFHVIASVIRSALERFKRDFDISDDQTPENYIEDFTSGGNINEMLEKSYFSEDAKPIYFKELSLQQAVEMAWLLMKVEIDMQKYTKAIPSVGGQIKLATITTNDGVEFHCGHRIRLPEGIQNNQ